jgi:hypothetical protein
MSSVHAEPPPPAPAIQETSGSGRDDGLWRRGRSNPTRADFLETVVSAYELLEPEERHETALRIGRGPKISYSKAFCRIEHYFAAIPALSSMEAFRYGFTGPTLRCDSSIVSSELARR